jgi:colanic acid/amylovoran biosynthesis glycosyltransferase
MVSFHGYDFSSAPLKEGAGMYAKLFETADVVTVNSEFTCTQVQNLGCPPAKLRKMPEGLNPDDFSFHERTTQPGEPIRIVTVARLVKKKGHEFSLRAFAKVREKHPKVHYDLIGDGPLRSNLENLVDQLGLRDDVTFCGACDNVEVRRRMADSHIFVLASVSGDGDQEGQGLVLQEAQAAGLPVLATLHGPFPEGILPGQSGYLVPERDAEALAERLSYLVEHPQIWPEMGRQGRAFVAQGFDIRKLNRQLVDLYEEMIDAEAKRCR